ncbi:CoA pyrophosphatase [Oceanospirillum linum]|uniref:CoA pyrophosphatase n=1 Tax=Oceanospirillum linum TaxID=966 RepID=UPI00089F5ED7|nr:CoA pyrophosphatase [Oceanospirillum linum]SEF74178.1 NUDIX domain-containing protein [Oleiphilus messinensis]SMP16625.1 NUDIX domain-containing protein [Oceanospirillum linum]
MTAERPNDPIHQETKISAGQPTDYLARLREKLTHFTPSRIKGPHPDAAVLIALTDDPFDPEIILTRRASHLSSHSGQVAFPGGMRDKTDRNLKHTALRESEEEVAMPPEHVEIIGKLNQVVSHMGVRVTPWVGIVPANIELTANEDELDAIFRVPLSFFLRDERHHTDVIPVEKRAIYVPCYHFDEFVIWGLSAMMLVDLLDTGIGADISLTKAPEPGSPLRHLEPSKHRRVSE